jgi:hypothetical protein
MWKIETLKKRMEDKVNDRDCKISIKEKGRV